MRACRALVLLAVVGCGTKPDTPPTPTPVPPRIEVRPEPLPTAPPPPPKPKDAEPNPPKDAVPPPSPADRARLTALEKAGAAVHGPEADGGYVVRIERDTKLEPALAALRGLTCVGNLTFDRDELLDSALAALDGLDNLDALVVQASRVGAGGFAVLPKLKRLKSLVVVGPLPDAACAHIAVAKGLQEVRLIGAAVTDAGLAELAALPLLDTLSLEGTKLEGTAFARPGWSKLRDLDASRTGISGTGAEAVGKLPALEILKVASYGFSSVDLDKLRNAKALTELDLSDAAVTDAGIPLLAGMNGLRVLNLSGTQVSGQAFDHLPTSLRKLTLDDSKFNDDGAKHLARLTELTTLSAEKCVVSDSGLAALGGLKKLTKVTLTGTKAGDGTARVLGTLPALEVANFSRTGLTDAGLRELVRAPRLRFVEARGSKVTKQGAAEGVKFGPDGLRIDAG